jgi:hypothetical protein
MRIVLTRARVALADSPSQVDRLEAGAARGTVFGNGRKDAVVQRRSLRPHVFERRAHEYAERFGFSPAIACHRCVLFLLRRPAVLTAPHERPPIRGSL